PAVALALRSMDGVFLSPSEDEFVGRIAAELERFLQQGQHQRVLLFPPLPSRLRYLIHRCVENVELLSSFSVGEGWRRRTVICHSAVRLPTETSSDQRPGPAPGRSQRPTQLWGRGGRGGPRLRPPGDTHGDNSRISVGSGRITRPPWKRPDKAVYVAKNTRKKSNWRERDGEDAAPGGENCPPKNSSQGRDGGKQQQQEEEDAPAKGSAEHPVCDEKVPPSGNSQDSREQEIRDRDCSHSKPPARAAEQDSTQSSQFQRQENQPSPDPQGWRRSEVAEALGRSLGLAAGDAEGTRQSGLEDESAAELLAEVMAGEVGKFGEDLGRNGSLGGLEGKFGKENLGRNCESGFKIQWVDDTHALGIFSSPSTASQALGRRYPSLKIRPLIHASKQARLKALQRPKLLQLGKERPQTDTAVARRLVSHALGWRHRQQEPTGNEDFQPESLDQEE
ncbi:R3HC1 protein, partial [Copsychus sechellarum]|nr:R3HC1 protein [Copsychus sechellarum]